MLAMIKDPIVETYDTLRSMNKRQLIHQTISLLLILTTALMIWKSLILVSGSESPVVVVLSGSMEPTFYRGDILFLWMGEEPFEIGEIVVYKVKEKEIPIIHRIIEVHHRADGTEEVLTKGDANAQDDAKGRLYSPGQLWLTREELVGRANGFLPYLGMVTIYLTDYPWLKYALIGIMGLFVITAKE